MMAAIRSSVLCGLMARLGRLSVSSTPHRISALTVPPTHLRLTTCSALHTTSRQQGLMEFFDDKKNWGELEVKVGRSWKVEELRIKSNEDLHKLWFVLLKEKNMLLTMEHECKEEYRIFPNPERIDKVEESMKNLETVVKERNRAYWLLETGEDGERPGAIQMNNLGLWSYKKFTEHSIPMFMNKNAYPVRDPQAGKRFRRLRREQIYLEKKKAFNRMKNHVCMLLRRFPDMDMNVLQQKYPEVNVEALRRKKRSLGHHSKNIA